MISAKFFFMKTIVIKVSSAIMNSAIKNISVLLYQFGKLSNHQSNYEDVCTNLIINYNELKFALKQKNIMK